LIVFDASAIVSAALKADSVPERALLRAEEVDVFALSAAVDAEIAVRVTDCRDTKDNRYLELALAAGAETIVSGDYDLLVLHPWRGVRIMHPADYLALT
jgi:predicted nucleic acid-binding protein